MTIPSKSELKILIQENYIKEYGSIDDIYKDVDTLCDKKVSNEDFVYDKVSEFIRRNNIEEVLGEAVDTIESSGEINLDVIASKLNTGMNLNFTKSPVYKLSDISKVKEIKEDALGSSENPITLKCFIEPINWCMQYKALTPGTLNMVVAPPGRGKTTFLINQGVSTAQQDLNVLHVFLGDMTKYDGLLRYLSCLSGVDTSRLVDLNEEELVAFIKKWNMSGILSHIYIASYGADELSTSQLIEEVTSIQKENKVHFHAIIIDYDENLAKDVDSMYESGGNVYNKIALFAVINKSIVFIAAQPKKEYWSSEVIPLEAAAESSKKQKIIDLMLTIGSKNKSSSVATLNIAKNRRGEDGKLIRLKKIGSNARFEPITEDEYVRLQQVDKSMKNNLSDKE